jgi:transcriptional regulator with XRE-family HTH domain
MDVAKRIINLRENAGLSTNRLAKLAGIGQSTLSDIEKGKVKPSIDSLEKICETLGISMSDFFTESKLPTSDRINRLTPKQREALEVFLNTLDER